MQPRTHGVSPTTRHSLLVTFSLHHFITPSLIFIEQTQRTEPGDRVPGTWHPIPGTWSDPMDAPLRPLLEVLYQK